jgi:hypothetical protein
MSYIKLSLPVAMIAFKKTFISLISAKFAFEIITITKTTTVA